MLLCRTEARQSHADRVGLVYVYFVHRIATARNKAWPTPQLQNDIAVERVPALANMPRLHTTCGARAIALSAETCTLQLNGPLEISHSLCGADCDGYNCHNILIADIWQVFAAHAHRQGSHDRPRTHQLAVPVISSCSYSSALRCQASGNLKAVRCRHMSLRFHRRSSSTCCGLRSVLGLALL